MAVQLEQTHGVRIAVEGCGHGTLHAIYASIEESCKQKGWPGVDLLIIGGDFQSVRNAFDLNCVSMPAKYREMCDFHEYYSGQRVAPCLTLFVGGNHEASNYLFELYYGGWVAPNIYYMGAANVLCLGPLRIAGMSGIWKGFDYRKPHYERLPYNESDMRSVYHVRELDVRKLLQIRTQVDIGVSHDWPQGVEWKGNWKQLFRFKKHFEDDARTGRLDSVAAKHVLDRLRPSYWFSAHLHCKYAAVVAHEEPPKGKVQPLGGNDVSQANDRMKQHVSCDDEAGVEEASSIRNDDEIELDLDLDDDTTNSTEGLQGLHTTPAAAVSTAPSNVDEIDLEMDDESAQGDTDTITTAPSTSVVAEEVHRTTDPVLAEARAALPASFARPKAPEPIEHPPEIGNKETSFLALDKCLPNRHFLQLINIPCSQSPELPRPLKLTYDQEWLAITRSFALSEPTAVGDPDAKVPVAKSQAEYHTLIAEQSKWVQETLSESDFLVPEDFTAEGPVYDGGHFQAPTYQQVMEYPNPQTERYCQMLQIPNLLEISEEARAARLVAGPRLESNTGFRADRGRGGFNRGRGRGGRGNRGRGGRGGRFRGR